MFFIIMFNVLVVGRLIVLGGLVSCVWIVLCSLFAGRSLSEFRIMNLKLC
jgi:hypothetical protein